MMTLHLSSGKKIGDCLGGLPSSYRLQANIPYVAVDSLGMFRIVDSHVLAPPNAHIILRGFGTFVSGWMYYPGNGTDVNFLATATLPAIGAKEKYYINENTNEYITLQRVAAGNVTGQMMIRFAETKNPVWGRPNNSEDEYYSCVYLRYDGEPANITHFEASGGGTESLSQAMSVAPIGDHKTEPEVTWGNDPLDSGTITPGWYPIWIRVSAPDEPYIRVVLDNGESIEFSGVFENRLPDPAPKRFRVYGAYDGRTVGGDLLGESDSRPVAVELDAPATGERTYRLRLVEVSPYGIESQNQLLEHEITIDAEGKDVTRPLPPDDMEVSVLKGGFVKVRVLVEQRASAHPTALVELDVEPDAAVEISKSGWFDYVTSEPVDWGTELTVTAVAVDALLRRSDPISRTITAEFDTSATIDSVSALSAADASCSAANSQGVLQAGDDIALIGERDETVLYIEGEEVWRIAPDKIIKLAPGWIVEDENTPQYMYEGSSLHNLDHMAKLDDGVYALTNGKSVAPIRFFTAEKKMVIVSNFASVGNNWITPPTAQYGGSEAVHSVDSLGKDVFFQGFAGQYFTLVRFKWVSGAHPTLFKVETSTLPLMTQEGD